MTRQTAIRTKQINKLGLSIILTLPLIFLIYTSFILGRKLIVDQTPCGGSLPFRSDGVNSYEAEVAIVKKAMFDLRVETSKVIQSKDRKIAELERQRGKVEAMPKEDSFSTVDRAQDGIRPLRVTVTHYPRGDRLGAFTLTSIFLLSITYRWGWEMETLPYRGSPQFDQLQSKYAKLGKKGQYRKDYNPTELNSQVYTNLGFFPKQPYSPFSIGKWTEVSRLPAPGSRLLQRMCGKNPIEDANGHVKCRLILPLIDATGPLQKHILSNGKLDNFFPASFRQLLRDRFTVANSRRLKHFSLNSTDYNVAIHVRRGDVTREEHPYRWTDQSVYAAIARHICKLHPDANIHVFSEGENNEGWTTLEEVADTCHGDVLFHLYENEFDVWAHFVLADALVTSRSAFSYVPALLSGGEIYAPEYGHPPLRHWHVFKNENGTLKRP